MDYVFWCLTTYTLDMLNKLSHFIIHNSVHFRGLAEPIVPQISHGETTKCLPRLTVSPNNSYKTLLVSRYEKIMIFLMSIKKIYNTSIMYLPRFLLLCLSRIHSYWCRPSALLCVKTSWMASGEQNTTVMKNFQMCWYIDLYKKNSVMFAFKCAWINQHQKSEYLTCLLLPQF